MGLRLDARQTRAPHATSHGIVDFVLLADVLATVRRASAADNALLVELMAQVPMEGSLVLSTRRDPDFFALYQMQKGISEAFIYDDGAFAGMGAILVRDGYLDGRAQPVGYLGDLRFRGRGSARRAFPAAYGHFFAESAARTGCESYLTGVLASNALALSSLAPAKRKQYRAPQPYYHPLRRYDMASIQCVLPPRRRVHDVTVTTATPDDLPALSAFLDVDHRTRPFGYRFDDGELEHRLAHWPGFSLSDTFVARAGGAVVGCCTAWDAAPVKRYRVVRYAGDMKLIRAALLVASKIVGCPPLPRAGEDFRYLYLTNLSVARDDVAVLRALLHAVYAHAWSKRVHFFSFPLYENDPWAPALQGFVSRRLPFILYAVTSSKSPRTAWPATRPGFEMALA